MIASPKDLCHHLQGVSTPNIMLAELQSNCRRGQIKQHSMEPRDQRRRGVALHMRSYISLRSTAREEASIPI